MENIEVKQEPLELSELPEEGQSEELLNSVIVKEEYCLQDPQKVPVSLCNVKTEPELEESQKENEDEKKFECKICSRRFKTPGNLKTHKRAHKAKKYKCEVCKKDFLRRKDWKNHRKRHHLLIPCTKPFCEEAFDSLTARDKHLKEHTGNKIRCKVCNKVVKSQEDMPAHMQIHRKFPKDELLPDQLFK
ncbi:zinc finger protein 18-like [Lutzomyia longipalpis]|uniref:zinc finger protein 18-like n=1 Tax=Lutzomyia longipalpis TaxID=7200 RepID=UPI002484209B|nr:zinc finger protein 18-like [Lutzomyia longipalpis]